MSGRPLKIAASICTLPNNVQIRYAQTKNSVWPDIRLAKKPLGKRGYWIRLGKQTKYLCSKLSELIEIYPSLTNFIPDIKLMKSLDYIPKYVDQTFTTISKSNQLVHISIDNKNDEWIYMWNALESKDYLDEHNGEVWEYMGTIYEQKTYACWHEFRHRCHPSINNRYYVNVPASETFKLSVEIEINK